MSRRSGYGEAGIIESKRYDEDLTSMMTRMIKMTYKECK
jgi:hypothetical protein